MRKIECVSINPSIDVSSQCNKIQAIHKVRLEEQVVYPGGGSVNVARVIQLLGGMPSLTYVAGGDTGNILKGAIQRLAIPSKCIDTNIDTRIAFNVLDQTSGLEYRFIPKGAALPMEAIDAMVKQVASTSPDCLVLSGSLPAQASPDIYARMATTAALQGTKVFLDCSGQALASALETNAIFLAKPSLSELSQLAGRELNRDAAIEFALSQVHKGSAKYLAVSMGKQGAFLASESGVIYSAALKIPVRSAVGAGDSFLAAMVHRIAAHDTVNEALRWGTAAGAAAVTTKGTKLCERKVLKQLLSKVELTHL